MEAVRTPLPARTVEPVDVDMWSLSIDGTTVPADAAMWLEGEIPVLRLFAASSPVSGHSVAVLRDGVLVHIAALEVRINHPVAVTLRFT